MKCYINDSSELRGFNVSEMHIAFQANPEYVIYDNKQWTQLGKIVTVDNLGNEKQIKIHAPKEKAVSVGEKILEENQSAIFQAADFMHFQEGELPIIISAPHGGRMGIPGVARRTGKGVNNDPDTNTQFLAHAIASSIEQRLGKKPYFVISQVHRKYVDLNRPPETAFEHPRAGDVYNTYHGKLNEFCDGVYERFGKGLFIDVHGQAVASNKVFRGTRNGHTVKNLSELLGKGTHIGPQSFSALLHEQNIPIQPLNGARETTGFTGGHIAFHYGKKKGIGAVQLEFGSNFRKTEELASVAAKVGSSVVNFAELHLTDFEPLDFLTYQEGELPIIISAPHGGRMDIPGVAQRTGNGVKIEPTTNTHLLAHAIANYIEGSVGKKPYFVIGQVHRQYVDLNRSPESAFEQPRAGDVYNAYHGKLEEFCNHANQRFGKALLIDIHGQSVAPNMVFRGTRNGRTVRNLSRVIGKETHVGPQSFSTLLKDQNIPLEPTEDAPEDHRYCGGYTVECYGNQGGVGAVQLEFGLDLRKRETFGATAEKVGNSVVNFISSHMPE